MAWFESVDDLVSDAATLRRRRYGVIVMKDQCLEAIRLRPWPKLLAHSGSLWFGGRSENVHRVLSDQCWLYYNQPRRFPDFLALKYIVTGRRATLRTLRGALLILDEIARIKLVNAIVCEVANLRISDRLLRRWGWESHVPSSSRRHFIKRLYGKYPPPEAAYSLCHKNRHLAVTRSDVTPSGATAPAPIVCVDQWWPAPHSVDAG